MQSSTQEADQITRQLSPTKDISAKLNILSVDLGQPTGAMKQSPANAIAHRKRTGMIDNTLNSNESKF